MGKLVVRLRNVKGVSSVKEYCMDCKHNVARVRMFLAPFRSVQSVRPHLDSANIVNQVKSSSSLSIPE